MALFLREIGFGITIIGALLTFASLVGFFFSVIGGVLADVIGRKKVLIITTFSLALAPLLLLAKQHFLAWTAMAFYSFGFFGRRAAGRVFISEKFPQKYLGKGLGTYFAAVSIIASPASLIGGLLIKISYQTLFTVAGFLTLLSLVPLAVVKETLEVKRDINLRSALKEFKRKTLMALTFSKALIYYYLLFCAYLFATELVVPFLPIYSKDTFKFDEAEIGLIYTLSSLISFISFTFGGMMADKIGCVKAFLIALLLNITFLGVLPLSPHKLIFAILLISSSFSFAAHEAPEASFVISHVPKDIRATATATATTLQGITTSFGPIIGSYLWSFFHPHISFLAMIVIALGALALFGSPLLKQNKTLSIHSSVEG